MGKIWVILFSIYCVYICGQIRLATWYNRGVKLDDRKLIAASWDYPIGSIIKVCRYYRNGYIVRKRASQYKKSRIARCINVKIEDRWKKGGIGLTKRAFIELVPLRAGFVWVKLYPVKIVQEREEEHMVKINFGLFKVRIKYEK